MSWKLRDALLKLHSLPEITFTSQQPVRRASLALILRFVPRKSSQPSPFGNEVKISPSQSGPKNLGLSNFLRAHPESQYSAEILFIKRASRHNDRWSGQIGFPGGRRDPGDSSDLATCIREVSEEVGLDLSTKKGDSSIYIGSLTQRPVMSQFGQTLTMVLCPYVFLLTDSKKFDVKCQPEEISGAFWVPLDQLNEDLTSPLNQDLWHPVDFTRRLQFANKSTRFIPNWVYSIIGARTTGAGDMLFPAINLKPTEFIASSPSEGNRVIMSSQLPTDYFRLWGITYGIISDLLEFVNPSSILPHIRWPTFQNRDFHTIINLLSFRFKKRKLQELNKLAENYSNSNIDVYGRYLNGYFKYLFSGIGIGLVLRMALLTFISSVCVSFYQIFNAF